MDWREKLAANEHLHLHQRNFVSASDYAELRTWLKTLHPLWEDRYAARVPMREGQTSRRLLRPVYWLGNWQFACLEYYRPPEQVANRCMAAEPYPPVLARLVREIEVIAHRLYEGVDMPEGWTPNTCLINLYGQRLVNGRWVDSARVRAHKDFECGPVASVSLGERALFQFVENGYPGPPGAVLAEHWLENGSLQIFGGSFWKSEILHSVTEVERKGGHRFEFPIEDFQTRRINFTFRFVPDAHVLPFAQFPPQQREDIRGYVQTLAQHSPTFAQALREAD
jgi:alkylated DNA repair dioxygenase AlkB